MLKFFALAVALVTGTVLIAPTLTRSGSGKVTSELTQFKMDIPERAPIHSAEGITLNQIKQMASLENGDVAFMDRSVLQELAKQSPEDLIQAISAKGDGDVTEQTKRLVTFAVSKARGMMEEDGFFVRPGHTKPQE